MMSIFKAYDIRGKYPRELNEQKVVEIIKALLKFFKKGRIVVGHDVRLSSHGLYKTILKTFPKKNAKIFSLPVDLSTTPMLYFLVKKLKASGGIMVTASHDPKTYNGLNVVNHRLESLSGEEILRIMNKESRSKNA